MTDNVVRLYSRVARVYDAWTFFTESRSLRLALDSVAIRDGESVLEVAVGTGVTFREILRRNARGRNVGIDLTEAMLRRARRKAEDSGANFELRQADARSLPFPDAAFDVVVNANMLGVVPESMFDAILSEMFRVLRPGGRVVIVTMMRPRSRLSSMVYRVGAIWLGGWRDVDVEPFVRRAGFDAIRRHTVEQLGIPSEILTAMKN
jgi:ubiquinone/menaquinone biosynthesis C-methylase UbiE